MFIGINPTKSRGYGQESDLDVIRSNPVRKGLREAGAHACVPSVDAVSPLTSVTGALPQSL